MIVARWRVWLGFGFVHGGEREMGEEGKEKKKLERGDYFFGYIF